VFSYIDVLGITNTRIRLEKLIATHPVKELPALYETWAFITMFTTAYHWPVLSQINPISTLARGASCFPTNIFVCISHLPKHATPHLLLDFITLIIFHEE
jgi:hypothetical protein